MLSVTLMCTFFWGGCKCACIFIYPRVKLQDYIVDSTSGVNLNDNPMCLKQFALFQLGESFCCSIYLVTHQYLVTSVFFLKPSHFGGMRCSFNLHFSLWWYWVFFMCYLSLTYPILQSSCSNIFLIFLLDYLSFS